MLMRILWRAFSILCPFSAEWRIWSYAIPVEMNSLAPFYRNRLCIRNNLFDSIFIFDALMSRKGKYLHDRAICVLHAICVWFTSTFIIIYYYYWIRRSDKRNFPCGTNTWNNLILQQQYPALGIESINDKWSDGQHPAVEFNYILFMFRQSRKFMSNFIKYCLFSYSYRYSKTRTKPNSNGSERFERSVC